MTRISIIAALGLLFSSCIATDSVMKLNENGSGKFVIQYRVSQMVRNLGEKEDPEPEADQDNPFLLSKREVERSLSNIPGLKLNSVTEWEDERDYHVKIDLDFTSIEALQKAEFFKDMPVTLVRENGKTVYTQLISKGDEPADQESVDLLKSMFAGYDLVFAITAPRPIVSSNRGVISDDKLTATYSISLVDVMQLKEKTELVISW